MDASTNILICKNCEQEFTGNFCHHCGQKNISGRLNFKFVLQDFIANLFNLEAPILRTVKELTIRPGKFCRDFIEGKRVSKYKPVQYYLLIATVYFLFYFAFDINQESFNKSNVYGPENNTLQMSAEAEKINSGVKQFLVVFMDNIKYIDVAYILVIAFLAKLFFKKSGYNYVETLVTIFYIKAHALGIGLIFVLLEPLLGFAVFQLGGLVSLIYTLWAMAQFFNSGMVKGFFKSLLIFLLSQLVIIVPAIAGIIIYILITH